MRVCLLIPHPSYCHILYLSWFSAIDSVQCALDICFQLPIFFDVNAKAPKVRRYRWNMHMLETTKHISKNVNSHCVSRFPFSFDLFFLCCCHFEAPRTISLVALSVTWTLSQFFSHIPPEAYFSQLVVLCTRFSFFCLTRSLFLIPLSLAHSHQTGFRYAISRLGTSHLNKTIYQIDVNSTDSDL